MGIAVGAAIIVGDAISGRRFYWAVIAAFITFMGANTAGEQLRKSVFRVAGTVVGVIVGAVLAHLVGDVVWLQIVVIMVSLFLGLYLFRVNYAFMVVGITVMVSQLYVELDEFSNSLLLLRLAETSVGAGVAILTVLLVLPLHVGRVARVAARQQLETLVDLADRCLDRLVDPASAAGSDLQLRAAGAPGGRGPPGARGDGAGRCGRRCSAASRSGSPGLWRRRSPPGITRSTCCSTPPPGTPDLDARPPTVSPSPGASSHDSVGAVTAALAPAPADGGDGRPPERQYVRSASLFARVADALPGDPLTSRPQLALRDAQLLDGALVAEASLGAGVPVTDLDTVPR